MQIATQPLDIVFYAISSFGLFKPFLNAHAGVLLLDGACGQTLLFIKRNEIVLRQEFPAIEACGSTFVNAGRIGRSKP